MASRQEGGGRNLFLAFGWSTLTPFSRRGLAVCCFVFSGLGMFCALITYVRCLLFLSLVVFVVVCYASCSCKTLGFLPRELGLSGRLSCLLVCPAVCLCFVLVSLVSCAFFCLSSCCWRCLVVLFFCAWGALACLLCECSCHQRVCVLTGGSSSIALCRRIFSSSSAWSVLSCQCQVVPCCFLCFVMLRSNACARYACARLRCAAPPLSFQSRSRLLLLVFICLECCCSRLVRPFLSGFC